jgi:HK97 family phage major capsid protein
MNDQITNWQNERLHAATELRKLVEDVKTGNVEFTAEVRAELDRLNATIDQTAASIDAITRAEEATRHAEVARSEWERTVRPAVLDASDRRHNDELLSFLKGERRSLDLDFRQVAREAELIRSGVSGREFRDLVKGTAAAGGDTVPTTLMRTLYAYLTTFAGIRRTNVRIVTTASGENIDMPTVNTYGTAAIVGEGTALAENDATLAKVTLGAWKYGQLVQVSRELIDDSGIDILGFVAEDAGRALGIVTGNAYLNGSGSNAPTGALGAYATGVTGQNGATGLPSYKNLVDLVYSVAAPYRARGAYWMFRDAMVGSIRAITDTTGRPIWEPSSQVGQPDRLLGYPVIEDPAVAAMATGVVCGVFGDFSGFVIRDVGAMRFERSDEFAFSADLSTYRAVMRTDSKVLDTRSLRVYRGGTA